MAPDLRRSAGWVIAVLVLGAVLVAAVVIGIKLLGPAQTAAPTSECTVPYDGPAAASTSGASVSSSGAGSVVPAAEVFLTAVQLQHASTINAVGMQRGVPQRGRIIALATAFQESGLRNLPSGDRDSLGLFQQRPSQGWGTKAQIMDPVYAAGRFYAALIAVPGWTSMTLTKAAQAVQYSGFPDAYAKWESQAVTLAWGLDGSTTPRLSCLAGAPGPTGTPPVRPALAGASSANSALADVLAAARAEVGGVSLVAISADRRSAELSVSRKGTGPVQAARALAAWAVAHNAGSGVSFAGVADNGWANHAWGPSTRPLAAGHVSLTAG